MTCFKFVCVRNCWLCLQLNGDVYNYVGLEGFGRFVQHLSYLIHRTNKPCLKLRFQEHTRLIIHSEPQSTYALHILKHEYDTIGDTVRLPKHIDKPSLLLPYEQLYIQLFNELIPEQSHNEQNPMFQLLYNRYHTSHPTWYLN